MKRVKINNEKIAEGDWVATKKIKTNQNHKYTNAFVKKVLKDGKLKVIYGSYMKEAIIKASDCMLIKKKT